MKFYLLPVLVLLLGACVTSVEKSPARTALKLKVKYENINLVAAGEWLGGTVENPKYYTVKGEEIITPVFGVDIAPVTKRSISNNGTVLYPHAGYQVVGDLRIEHFRALIVKVQRLEIPRKSYKPPIISADSNFLEKGARIEDSERKLVVEYEFKALGWHVKR